MDSPRPDIDSVEKQPTKKYTRRRKRVSELSYIERRAIPDDFELGGPTSLHAIAEDCKAEISACLALITHKHSREIRRIWATLALKGAGAPERKPIASERPTLQIVPKVAS